MVEIIDSYQKFMETFNISKDDFIEFGISNSLFIEKQIAYEEWDKLKNNIISGNEAVYVRGYGRNATGTDLYMALYYEAFNHTNFVKDATNNDRPTKLLERLTGYNRKETASSRFNRIRNYQVSHIFGRTKNPYAFTAPWNVVYIPKIVDPFTGHESKGELTIDFTKQFQQYFYDIFEDMILDYNSIMEELQPRISNYLEMNLGSTASNQIQNFKKQVLEDFNTIRI